MLNGTQLIYVNNRLNTLKIKIMNYLVKYKLTDKETLILQIKSSYMKYEDDLSKALGIDFTPIRMYRFVGSSLTADETQIEPLSIDDLANLKSFKIIGI